MEKTHKELYPDELTGIQLEKYRQRKNNHWKIRIEDCLRLLPDKPHMRVLDLDCQVGTFALETAKRGHTATGLDLDPTAIACACRLAKEEGVADRCSFLVGDVTDTRLPDNAFDAVMAMDIIEHLPDDAVVRMLREAWRVLKPGGVFAAHVFPTKYDDFFASAKFVPFMLPLFLLPEPAQSRYLKACYWCFDRIWFPLRHKGITYRRHIARTPHCNPPDAQQLRRMIGTRTAFEISSYRVENLYPGDTGTWHRNAFKGCLYSRRHVLLTLTKKRC